MGVKPLESAFEQLAWPPSKQVFIYVTVPITIRAADDGASCTRCRPLQGCGVYDRPGHYYYHNE